jgi:hypothetical protein
MKMKTMVMVWGKSSSLLFIVLPCTIQQHEGEHGCTIARHEKIANNPNNTKTTK